MSKKKDVSSSVTGWMIRDGFFYNLFNCVRYGMFINCALIIFGGIAYSMGVRVSFDTPFVGILFSFSPIILSVPHAVLTSFVRVSAVEVKQK